MSSCESRALIQSQWNLWVTLTATGLVTLCLRKSQSSGHVEADGCALTSFSRRQSCVATSSGIGGVLRDVLDCGGTAAPAVRFSVNTTLSCDSLAARGIAQRAGLEKVKVLAVKTLWLQEVLCKKD